MNNTVFINHVRSVKNQLLQYNKQLLNNKILIRVVF